MCETTNGELDLRRIYRKQRNIALWTETVANKRKINKQKIYSPRKQTNNSLWIPITARNEELNLRKISRNEGNNSLWISEILKKEYYYDLKRKIRTRTGIRASNLRISSPALNEVRGSNPGSGSNFSLEIL